MCVLVFICLSEGVNSSSVRCMKVRYATEQLALRKAYAGRVCKAYAVVVMFKFTRCLPSLESPVLVRGRAVTFHTFRLPDPCGIREIKRYVRNTSALTGRGRRRGLLLSEFNGSARMD